jgi:hypothetical protein
MTAPEQRATNENAMGIDWASLRFMYFLLAERRQRHGMVAVWYASPYYGPERLTYETIDV